MSVKIQIGIPPESQKVIENLQTLPARTLLAIAKVIDVENLNTNAHIHQNHLTGVGPFPPEQHKLGVRSARLFGSVLPSKSVVNGQQIVSSIGSNVKYAAIHEFGGRIQKKARKEIVRHRVDARGTLLRQLNHPNLAVFAGNKHKRARAMEVTIPAHDVLMPERAPIRTGIKECLPNYYKSIARAVAAAFKP